MDKIIIDSLRLFAYHGVNPEEQEDGQFFILDIEADIPLSKAGALPADGYIEPEPL